MPDTLQDFQGTGYSEMFLVLKKPSLVRNSKMKAAIIELDKCYGVKYRLVL
jgi:hypothetical protein